MTHLFQIIGWDFSLNNVMKKLENFILQLDLRDFGIGWSEKHKSWKMQKYRADSEPRHSTDFRTIFGIMIG